MGHHQSHIYDTTEQNSGCVLPAEIIQVIDRWCCATVSEPPGQLLPLKKEAAIKSCGHVISQSFPENGEG